MRGNRWDRFDEGAVIGQLMQIENVVPYCGTNMLWGWRGPPQVRRCEDPKRDVGEREVCVLWEG